MNWFMQLKVSKSSKRLKGKMIIALQSSTC